MAIDDRDHPSVAGPLDRVHWPARTKRLSIRPARIEDAEATWVIRSLADVHRWLSSAPGTRSEWAAAFQRRLPRTLVIERDRRVIGDLMVRVQDGWSQSASSQQAAGTEAELGWVLDPAYSGHGYATEAVTELLRICFTDLGLRRVVAHCFAPNEASWRLMERVGMRREAHTVEDSLHAELGWLDGYSYAILAREWADRALSTL